MREIKHDPIPPLPPSNLLLCQFRSINAIQYSLSFGDDAFSVRDGLRILALELFLRVKNGGDEGGAAVGVYE